VQCLYNNNANNPISASGNYCSLVAPIGNIGDLLLGGVGTRFGADLVNGLGQGLELPMIDLVSYLLAPNASGGGTVTFQALEMDMTGPGGAISWRALASPIPLSLAPSTNLNGIINGPFLGIRMNFSGVAGACYARLSGSVRSM
jgi:hypothetical protein